MVPEVLGCFKLGDVGETEVDNGNRGQLGRSRCDWRNKKSLPDLHTDRDLVMSKTREMNFNTGTMRLRSRE